MEFTIKSSILDRDRQLLVERDFIEFDNNDLISATPTKFSKEEIIAFRYGINWIRGYRFIIGRIYTIDIRSSSDEIIKIRLKSLYGIRRKKLAEKYVQIINSIYDYFFQAISDHYVQQFNAGHEIQINGVTFCKEGIYLDNKNLLLDWLDVGTKTYRSYCAIYSQSNANYYKAFQYIKDWNTAVLYNVTRQILKTKGLDKG